MLKTLNHIIDFTNIERIKFRNDVNGLRAVAVLSVLIYHAELKIFTAGYLGVDIFFVLSGYLITNIIISDLNSNKFSFKSFYIRRIKRILPALFSVLIFTSVSSYLFLTPKMLLEYVKSLIPSTFFYSNIYFSNLDFYNSEPARYMPLIHTWSLAIEEQFYIIFPLFLYVVYKYFKKYIFYIFTLIIFISIYLNTSTDSIDKFYLIQYRSWELILGSVITIVDNKFPKNKYIAYIGSIIMFFPILFFNDFWITDIEPKLISLLGVSLILIFNTEQNLLNNIFSSKVFKKTGLWSYSIYLFHQPLFVFFRLFEEKNLPISWKSVEKEINLNSYILFLLLTLLIIFYQN